MTFFADLNRTEFYILSILSLLMIGLGLTSELITNLTEVPVKAIIASMNSK
jgi:NADH:ubiquinone oxidoreductase subunit 4 (subunit M)